MLEYSPSPPQLRKVNDMAAGCNSTMVMYTEKERRLAELGRDIKELNELNTYLLKYSACVYMCELPHNRYKWKLHNYITDIYMWLKELELDDLFDRKEHWVTLMLNAEKYFIMHPKCRMYKR